MERCGYVDSSCPTQVESAATAAAAAAAAAAARDTKCASKNIWCNQPALPSQTEHALAWVLQPKAKGEERSSGQQERGGWACGDGGGRPGKKTRSIAAGRHHQPSHATWPAHTGLPNSNILALTCSSPKAPRVY